jgi:hypothetical protein
MRLPRLCAALMLLAPALASADSDPISQKLTSFETEAHEIGTDLPDPSKISATAGQRRLLDAELAYSMGNNDKAALILLDIVGKQQVSDQEAAVYYLAEALYEKGDQGAARSYFEQIVQGGNTSGKYYQVALERLVEIAIKNKDVDASTYVSTLAGISPSVRSPAVPYVLGKYAYSQEKYDDALALFGQVPKGSDYELQALYFTGTTYVAKKDVGKATDVFADLVSRTPHSAVDRRVIELSQLALGRLYYEREEPSKSIDSYLLVDRHSDLFPDALYEVGWVYVKNKQYDKALRALELLELSDPASTKTATVRILEGNLRIRKAQMIREAQIAGTISTEEASDPATEYVKATKIFTETHDQYMPSYLALSQMVDGHLDPSSFVAQIAGRQQPVFSTAPAIPDAAAQWLRDQPEVQRFVGIETDLADIQSNIQQATDIIQRLDAVIAAKDHSFLYPELASRRRRIASIQNELAVIRNEIHDRAGVSSPDRKALASQFDALGNTDKAFGDRVADAHNGYGAIDKTTVEIDSAIGSAQAMAVALRMYATTAQPPMADDQKKNLETSIDEAAKEAQAIEDELADTEREIQLGRDLTAMPDEALTQAHDLRKQLTAAQDAEARSLGSNEEAQRAMRLADSLDQTDAQIAAMVEQALVQARSQLEQETKSLADYKTEEAGYETEARDVGATALGASFKDVKAKFYDVIVRTDVGNVDVLWSEKEDNDDDLKRLNLARSRDLKQLRDEFKDILETGTQKPSERAPVKSALPPPTEGQSGSPDKGAGDQRVSPGGNNNTQPTQPTVKPDENKTAPKATSPKGRPAPAANKGGTP